MTQYQADPDTSYRIDKGLICMQGLRTVFQDQLHSVPPTEPAPLPARAYGIVSLTEAARLFDALDVLAGKPTTSRVPLTMEQYSQGCAEHSLNLVCRLCPVVKRLRPRAGSHKVANRMICCCACKLCLLPDAVVHHVQGACSVQPGLSRGQARSRTVSTALCLRRQVRTDPVPSDTRTWPAARRLEPFAGWSCARLRAGAS